MCSVERKGGEGSGREYKLKHRNKMREINRGKLAKKYFKHITCKLVGNTS